MSSMPSHEYEFTLILGGVRELTTEVENALFEAGCDDATISIQHGAFSLEFCRESTSFLDAVLSAIHDVSTANIGAIVEQVDECNLVTQAEIARRCGRTRQLISLYISGSRGPGGFPPPACHLSENMPLWRWCEVSYWLAANDMIKQSVVQEAEVISAVNNALERQLHECRNRALVRKIESSLEQIAACE